LHNAVIRDVYNSAEQLFRLSAHLKRLSAQYNCPVCDV
jgi:branched-subunit amino acid aminotransferase/4-amino-4-deoxychorismate lyase